MPAQGINVGGKLMSCIRICNSCMTFLLTRLGALLRPFRRPMSRYAGAGFVAAPPRHSGLWALSITTPSCPPRQDAHTRILSSLA